MRKKLILFICPNPEKVAPSQRLKYEQYFDHFNTIGFDVSVSSFKTKHFWNIVYKKGHYIEKAFWTCIGYLKRILYIPLLPFYDIVYIHLNVTPFGGPFFEWIYILMNPNVIYDIDDLVFIDNKSNVNAVTSYLKSPQKYFYLFKKARQVIVCTPFLKEFANKYSTQVTDISSTINTDRYTVVNKYKNNQIITIGWSGSHSTVRYFLLLKEVLVKLKKVRDFKLIIFGVDAFEINGIEMDVIPFDTNIEVSVLQQMDIGLYPLPLNEEWVYGKSGLKALQYMAVGIPTVATRIGANLRIMEHNTSGLLVTTQEEWLNSLIRLIDNPVLRKSIGQNGRRNVEEHYSVHSNKEVYQTILYKTID